ncbi:hypothetical protein VTL71DRAFT_8513, partial [Oculimacula yallundae]
MFVFFLCGSKGQVVPRYRNDKQRTSLQLRFIEYSSQNSSRGKFTSYFGSLQEPHFPVLAGRQRPEMCPFPDKSLLDELRSRLKTTQGFKHGAEKSPMFSALRSLSGRLLKSSKLHGF